MIIKKQLTLQTTRSNIIETVQKHIRNVVPYGHVDESSFCIYKTTTMPFKKSITVYVVTGKIDCVDNKVKMTIKIRPNIVTFLLAAYLAIALVIGLYSFICETATLEYVICEIMFNLLFHSISVWQMQRHISELVKEFNETASKTGDGSV